MKGILYICLIILSAEVWAQDESTGVQHKMLTDRSLYLTGELIHFWVFGSAPQGLMDPELSKVFYLELVSPDGTSLSQTKNRLDSAGVTGTLKIPTDIGSGKYYLKGYTRWMRQEGPEQYIYLEVSIVNAGSKKILRVNEKTVSTVNMQLPGIDQFPTGPLQAELISSYKRRSQINLSLSNPGQFAVSCGITVVRDGLLDYQRFSHPGPSHELKNAPGLIPETRGVSLSGKIQFSESGTPAPYALVYLSYIGSEKQFLCNYADSTGRFYFTLPEGTGERELFISANHDGDSELELFVDLDFCTEPVILPSLPLEIDSSEVELIKSMWINEQIRQQYHDEEMQSGQVGEGTDYFFYGQPLTVIRFDDFIRLPTLEEYFTEVTPEVSVKRVNRKKTLRVLGEHPDLEFYSPLVMIDGVAIFDIESLLAASPRLVDRFEIINAPYIKGNVIFGGIINVVTRKGDLGAIDLPASGSLVRYKLYSDTQERIEGHKPEESRIPDERNTLFWEPEVYLSPGESGNMVFSTPDYGGDFQVLIRGIDSKGKYFSKTVPFRVE
jgi:hypothetical protein